MARLHEFQGKALLEKFQIPVPRGGAATTPEEVREICSELNCPIVVKAQAWITGRAAYGGIQFATSADEAARVASEILGKQIKGFTVDTVLVEERLDIEREFYAGVIIDDKAHAPVMLFSSIGGSGIEEIASEHPDAVAKIVIDVRSGLLDYQARDLVRRTGIHGKQQMKIANMLVRLYKLAHDYDARAAEINPIVLTSDERLIAADCRITIDDYAVYRHPDLGIEIAREFDRPATELEKIAWQVEKNDYRGTFYFIQLEQGSGEEAKRIGFHGAGGGGSMMSMDAVLNRGYALANFVDTSGNPPASKVYRAAKLILSQEDICGYFASGSGVASQEQFHSARGLVKAFMEVPLNVPAVIRLGGNAEERAIAILERARDDIPAPVEAYGKDDSPEYCAERLDHLIRGHDSSIEGAVGVHREIPREAYAFDTVSGGKVIFNHELCKMCESKICIETCVPGILVLEKGLPTLKISEDEARKGGCIECLACDVECYFEGNRGGYVDLPIPSLEIAPQDE